MLTTEQIKSNITAFEKQGASPQEIQTWLDSLKNNNQKTQTITPENKSIEKKSFLSKVGDFVLGSEQKFGKDLATGLFLATGGQKKIDKISQGYLENGNKLIDLAKKTTDLERKKKLLQMANDDFKAGGKTTEEIIGEIKSNKQILGDASGVLLDILSAGTYGKTTKLAPTLVSKVAEKVTVGKGIKQGIKIGGLWGGVSGAVSGLQENKSALGVVGSTLTGAGIGAVTGGTLGGISGGIQNKLLNVSKQEKALKSIVPLPNEITANEYSDLLKKGLVTPKTKSRTAQIIPNDEQITLANKFSDLLQGKDAVSNSKNIIDELVEADTRVGSYLSKRDINYSQKNLKSFLSNKIKPVTDIYVPNQKNVEKLKSEIIDTFLNKLNGEKLTNLWENRKLYDYIINEKLNAFGGSNTLKKELARSLRNGVQEFITNQTSEGVYKEEMKHMTDLFKVFDLVSNKAEKEKNLSGIMALIKKYPTIAKIIGASGIFGIATGATVYGVSKLGK
jgi:hypothetical protein